MLSPALFPAPTPGYYPPGAHPGSFYSSPGFATSGYGAPAYNGAYNNNGLFSPLPPIPAPMMPMPIVQTYPPQQRIVIPYSQWPQYPMPQHQEPSVTIPKWDPTRHTPMRPELPVIKPAVKHDAPRIHEYLPELPELPLYPPFQTTQQPVRRQPEPQPEPIRTPPIPGFKQPTVPAKAIREKVLEPAAPEKTDQPHDHAAHAGKLSKSARWKSLAMAAGFAGLGLLLHKMPQQLGSQKYLISSDWKDIARIVFGIATVQKVNQALDWKPKPWMAAIEAVAIMNPIAFGVLKANGAINWKTFIQSAVMGGLLAPVVQLSATINNKTIPWLKEKFNIPVWIPRLAMIAGMVAFGMKVYPRLYNGLGETGILGKEIKKEVTEKIKQAAEMATANALVCYRACCAGSIFCLTEIGEIVASIHNGSRSLLHRKEHKEPS